MAPVLAFSDYQAAVSASTLTSASFTPSAGDVLVVKTGTWSTGVSPGAPTDSSGQTWTQRVVEAGGGFNGRVEAWTAVVSGSPGAITVSITPASSSHHTLLVERWTGATLAATPATGQAFVNTATAAASATLTSTGADSVVSWVCYDNNSSSPTGRAYLSSATEEAFTNGGGNGVFYNAYQSAATAGVQTFGLSAPTTMRYNIAGIEILAAATSVGGALAGATPALSGALAGTVVDSGALAGSTPPASGALAGTVVDAGVLAGSTPPAVATLAGTVTDAGALAGSTPPTSGALAGTVTVAGALAGSTPPLVGALTSAGITTGALAGATPRLVGALVGIVRMTGALAGSTPRLAGALSDAVAQVAYPLRAGTVLDNLARLAAGGAVDNAVRYGVGEAVPGDLVGLPGALDLYPPDYATNY